MLKPPTPPTAGAVSNNTQTARAMPEPSAAGVKMRKLEPKRKPPFMCLIAEPGWGKTSFAAFAPEVGIVQARGETGYETLLGVGRVPSVDCATVESWTDLMGLVRGLSGYKHVAFDALAGLERLCFEKVCKERYNGDWTDKGFAGYGRGPEVSITEWLVFLQELERLNNAGTGILIMSHCMIRPFKNPLGDDYDKFIPDCHQKIWAVTHKRVDSVLFGHFQQGVKDGKATGTSDRIVYTEHSPAFEAKSRYGLTGIINIPNTPDNPAVVWETLSKFI